MLKGDTMYLTVRVLILVMGGINLAIPAKAAPSKVPLVFVEVAKKTEIADQLTYPARLSPQINATVLSETDGVVESIRTPLGRNIKKGEEVMRIKHTDPVFEYAPVRITAPVSGVISRVDVTIGSRVTKGEKLAAITDPSKVRVLIEVAAADLNAVKKGLRGTLHIQENPKPIGVKVLGVSPVVDEATSTATAELAFTNEQSLPPGLVGKVTFRVNAHQGFALSETAVVYRGKKTYLRVVEEKKAKLVPVTLGPSRQGIVEIKEGINENAVVIVRSNQFISDGEEVKVEHKAAE